MGAANGSAHSPEVYGLAVVAVAVHLHEGLARDLDLDRTATAADEDGLHGRLLVICLLAPHYSRSRIDGVRVIPTSNPSGLKKRLTV